MNEQTAIQVLDQTVAEVKMTRQDHFTAMQAVETLQRVVHENQTFKSERDKADTQAAEQAAKDAETAAIEASKPKAAARPSRSRKK